MSCKHCNIDYNKIIYKGKYWTLSFNKQDYLGRCVLTTNKHISKFDELNDEEVISLRNMLKAIEKELKDLYGCTMLNWCCNMNNVFAKENPDPHVHIHIRPRYKNSVNINGIIYKDNEFGAHYDRFAPIQFDEETIKIIFNQMRDSFKKYHI